AAQAFTGADRLGVAVLEEARQLRAAGIQTPLLIAEGCFDKGELQEAAALGNIACVVHSPWQVELLATTPLAASVDIWLKLDSGMHRLGMVEAELRRQYQRLLTLPRVAVTHVMTHLACADKTEDELSQQQMAA